jgi:hypothetical protein
MFYNIKIREHGKDMGNGKGDVYLIILYIGGDESDGVNGINGVDCGELFSRQGKMFFLTGEKLLEGKRVF